ncbi:hypothetical protein OSB04_015940 [Centaurea solstitialis]|uniref:Cupin type-1 domain-containing protein n=1 Tax=Centaurea solstitialis TaxID=347529 RepID=A0AA38SZZ4_9ASTR|nr:hypothetical protein OSB04_015940 [Centaurea solstitialis]
MSDPTVTASTPTPSTKEFNFKEADLDSIDLEDIMFLINYLQGPILRNRFFINGLEVLKRYIRHSVSLARVTDYQLAIDSRSPRVNLLPPILSLDKIREYYLFCPITSPEEGIVYPNRKGERRFMRYREISHFCDGTLIYILNGLKHRMNKSEMPGAQWENRLRKFKDGVKRIEKKLKERMILRRVEMALRLRQRTITTWEQYLQLSRWIRLLSTPPPFHYIPLSQKFLEPPKFINNKFLILDNGISIAFNHFLRGELFACFNFRPKSSPGLLCCRSKYRGFVNGVVCKDPNLVQANDFLFRGLQLMGDTSNDVGLNVTVVTITQLPGLNTFGISMARIDFTLDDINPPHTHRRATEVLVLSGRPFSCRPIFDPNLFRVRFGSCHFHSCSVQVRIDPFRVRFRSGFRFVSQIASPKYWLSLTVGFVTYNPENRLLTKVLEMGDVFVFPQGLIHFQRNIGHGYALAIAGLSSQNPGDITMTPLQILI